MNCNVAGAVLDNKAPNVAAWKLLQIKHPGFFSHGCIAHNYHLLTKDIFGAFYEKSKKENNLFDYLNKFTYNCKATVKFFHTHQIYKAKLKATQKKANCPGL